MLFKVSHQARPASNPAAEPISLHPQFEADSEEHARSKHVKWLEDTGYVLLEGVELAFELLTDSGFDPDVQEVLSLQDQVSNLQSKLAAAGDAPAQVVELKAQLKKQGADSAEAAKQLSDALGKAQASVEDLTSQLAAKDQALSDLNATLAVVEQKVADRDSQLATLSAQLEEALLPKANPAADTGTPPADGPPPAQP